MAVATIGLRRGRISKIPGTKGTFRSWVRARMPHGFVPSFLMARGISKALRRIWIFIARA